MGGRPSQLPQLYEQVVSTCGRVRWVEGKGEKEVPGNRWPEQDWGFQTRGWEGAGHLHLDTARELLPLPPLRREKSWGKGKAAFTETEGSNTPPQTPLPNREDEQGEGSWWKSEGGKGEEGCLHHPIYLSGQICGRPEAQVRDSR